MSGFRQEVSGAAVLASCVGVMVAGLGSLLLNAWLIMLGFGVIHHEISDQVPPIGFGAAILVTLALGVLASILRGAGRT